MRGNSGAKQCACFFAFSRPELSLPASLKLCLNCRDIGIGQVIEHNGQLLDHLLAALGKFQTFELSDLVIQILDDCLIAVDPLAHRFNRLGQRFDLVIKRLDALHPLCRRGAQLFRGQVIEIGLRSHGADFVRAGNWRRQPLD